MLPIVSCEQRSKTASTSSMKNPMSKRLWVLFVCLAIAGASCTKSRAAGVGPSYGYKGSPAIGSLLGQPADVEDKRPSAEASDALWATGEDRKRYKPLVVALARQDLLLQHPGVVGVRAGYGELRVYTTKPIMLPSQLWGVPVKPVSPSQCPTCVGGETTPETIPSAVPSVYHKYFRSSALIETRPGITLRADRFTEQPERSENDVADFCDSSLSRYWCTRP